MSCSGSSISWLIGVELKISSPVFPVAKESVWIPMRGMEDVLCCSYPHNHWIDDSFGFASYSIFTRKRKTLESCAPQSISECKDSFIWLGLCVFMTFPVSHRTSICGVVGFASPINFHDHVSKCSVVELEFVSPVNFLDVLP